MKTIKIGKSGSGVLGSIVAGQVMTLDDDAADEYINSGYAAEIGTAGDLTSRIDAQNAEIGQLKDELIECKNLLDAALGEVGDVDEIRLECCQLKVDNGALVEASRIEGDMADKYRAEVFDLRKQIADMLNAPVVGVDLGVGDKTVIAEVDGDGKVKNVVFDGNAESHLADLTDRQNENSGEVAKTNEKAVEGGELVKSGDEPDVVVAPAVVTGADGKRKKAMPSKGGKAAK